MALSLYSVTRSDIKRKLTYVWCLQMLFWEGDLRMQLNSHAFLSFSPKFVCGVSLRLEPSYTVFGEPEERAWGQDGICLVYGALGVYVFDIFACRMVLIRFLEPSWLPSWMHFCFEAGQ